MLENASYYCKMHLKKYGNPLDHIINRKKYGSEIDYSKGWLIKGTQRTNIAKSILTEKRIILGKL